MESKNNLPKVALYIWDNTRHQIFYYKDGEENKAVQDAKNIPECLNVHVVAHGKTIYIRK